MAKQRRSSIEKAIEESIEGWIAEGLIERTAWTGRPLMHTPLPRGRKVRYDPAAVERVLRFFLLLRQLIGRWAGQEFKLLDWQVRWLIAPVFGLKRLDGTRWFRTVWWEIPRKNGKSTLCSGLALYMLMADREPGAQVYAAAANKAQAGIVFKAARDMATGSKAIAEKLGKKGIQRALLEHPTTGAIFRALSKDMGGSQHGLNVSCAVIDEVHGHQSPDTIDALETGTGSRAQPLVVFITTADAGEDGSIYSTKREFLEGIVAGTIDAPSWFGVVFGVDDKVEGFDPFSDEALLEANPGAGVTVQWDYLHERAAEAKSSPAQLNRYLRLHLNIRTKQVTRWLSLADWDAAAGMADETRWKGATVYGGLDLSTTTDLTSFVLVLPSSTGVAAGVDIWPMFWLPEERAEQFEARFSIPFRAWAAAGHIKLTEGNVVDYATVRKDISAEIGRLGCQVASIGFDPWNASEIVQNLEKDGFVMEPCRQGYSTLSAPSKQLERLILGSTPKAPLCRHGGHPVLRWNADCVDVRADDNGNIKPVKPDRVKSSKRIDGIVATLIALRQASLVAVEEESDAAAWLAAMSARKAAG